MMLGIESLQKNIQDIDKNRKKFKKELAIEVKAFKMAQ